MLKWCEIAMFPWPVFIPLNILYNLQSVGQILGGPVEAGCHYPYDAESGEGEKLLTKLEIDTGTGKGTSVLKTKQTFRNPWPKSAPFPFFIFSSLFLLFQVYFLFNWWVWWQGLRGLKGSFQADNRYKC